MSNCTNCGAPFAPNSRFCTECGRTVAGPSGGPDLVPPMPPTGAARGEEIPGIRHAIPGDYDGDGTQELAVFTDTQSTTAEQISFYVHHPARGLVQIGSTSVPPIQ